MEIFQKFVAANSEQCNCYECMELNVQNKFCKHRSSASAFHPILFRFPHIFWLFIHFENNFKFFQCFLCIAKLMYSREVLHNFYNIIDAGS